MIFILVTPSVYSQSQKFDVIQIVLYVDKFIWCMGRSVSGSTHQARGIPPISKMSDVASRRGAYEQAFPQHILSGGEQCRKKLVTVGEDVCVVIVKERKLGSVFGQPSIILCDLIDGITQQILDRFDSCFSHTHCGGEIGNAADDTFCCRIGRIGSPIDGTDSQ